MQVYIKIVSGSDMQPISGHQIIRMFAAECRICLFHLTEQILTEDNLHQCSKEKQHLSIDLVKLEENLIPLDQSAHIIEYNTTESHWKSLNVTSFVPKIVFFCPQIVTVSTLLIRSNL